MKSANDSFDELPDPDISENALKTSSVPGRSKEERKKLIGFSCDACEIYYRHLDVSKQELEKAIQQCSRHRATSAPPKNSPKEIWKTEMSPDKEEPILYEELLTRKKRREMRKNRPKISKNDIQKNVLLVCNQNKSEDLNCEDTVRSVELLERRELVMNNGVVLNKRVGWIFVCPSQIKIRECLSWNFPARAKL